MMQDTLQRGDLFAVAPGSANPGLEARVSAEQAGSGGAGGLYSCIVADPPWDVKRGAPQGRPIGVQLASEPLSYPTMSVAEICALKVPAAKDAHLYIWTINKYIEASYAVARAWGFEPSTMLYWFKEPKGIGLGGTYALCVEPILFCRRGSLAAKKRSDRNWWTWPRGEHSKKPEAFQTVVEEHSPGPYLEMFARRERPGWSVWGNQVACDSELVRSGGGGGVLVGDDKAATRSAAGSQTVVFSHDANVKKAL